MCVCLYIYTHIYTYMSLSHIPQPQATAPCLSPSHNKKIVSHTRKKLLHDQGHLNKLTLKTQLHSNFIQQIKLRADFSEYMPHPPRVPQNGGPPLRFFLFFQRKTHKHTHTRTRIHTHEYTHTHRLSLSHSDTDIDIDIDTDTDTDTDTNTDTDTDTDTDTHNHTHTRTHAHTHTRTHTHKQTHTYTHTHIHTYTHTHSTSTSSTARASSSSCSLARTASSFCAGEGLGGKLVRAMATPLPFNYSKKGKNSHVSWLLYLLYVSLNAAPTQLFQTYTKKMSK